MLLIMKDLTSNPVVSYMRSFRVYIYLLSFVCVFILFHIHLQQFNCKKRIFLAQTFVGINIYFQLYKCVLENIFLFYITFKRPNKEVMCY